MPCAFHLDEDLVGPFRYTSSDSGCQFAVPEDELIPFDGEMWCEFHLPLKVGEVASPKADWTQEQIEAFNEEIFALIDRRRLRNWTVDLSGVVFSGKIFFGRYEGGTDSLPEILFFQTHFGGIAYFMKTHFEGHAFFTKALFEHDAHFTRANFGGYTYFEGASFRGDARFERASFAGYADFTEASFAREAHFEEAKFSDRINCTKIAFANKAHFIGAKFDRFADFMEAEFAGAVDFSASTDKETESNAATFHYISFADARFLGKDTPPCFHNRKFLGTTNFRGTVFERAPEFHGCTLHQDTVFPGEKNFRDRQGADAVRAYRTLKHAMASVHARGEEAKFYALEQKSLRASPDTGWWERLFSWLYEVTADYGQSFMRPLAALFISPFAFWLVYALFLLIYLDPWSNFIFPAIHCEDILRFSLQQVFQPFEAFRVRGGSAPPGGTLKVFAEIPLGLAILAAVHSVLTLSLLTFFLLALRRRFKLD